MKTPLLAIICVTSPSLAGSEKAAPSWTGTVAPIIQRHCGECHRPGGSAPFSLIDYKGAAKRAKQIQRLTRARVMPPWLPNEPKGLFVGERGLTAAEIETLSEWANGGAIHGEGADPMLPTTENGEWQLGPPDLVVHMPREFQIPSGPTDTYRAFVIPLDLESLSPDVRNRALIPDSNLLGVAGVEIHPGNHRSLHHAHVWADPTKGGRHQETTPGAGYEAFGNPGVSEAIYLGGYVPGATPRRLPAGIAEALPLGSDLVLQIHYSSTGKVESDKTSVGIYFSREAVKRTVEWMRLGSYKIEIPAGDSAYTIRDELIVPADSFLLSLSPHMHFLGKKVRAHATFPDGKVRELLTIDRWNFNWQDRYTLKEPLALPTGTKISAEWIYDNSDQNPQNPFTPARRVSFGPNSTDEMCELHLFVVPWSIEDYPAYSRLMEEKQRDKIGELTPDQRRQFGFEK